MACNSGTFDEVGTAKDSGDDRVMTAATEGITEFAMLMAEAFGRFVILETPHTSDPTLDAAMILLKTTVEACTCPVQHRSCQHRADCSRIGAVAVRRHPVRQEAQGRPGRMEEGLRHRHVAIFAQLRVDQVTMPVDRPTAKPTYPGPSDTFRRRAGGCRTYGPSYA